MTAISPRLNRNVVSMILIAFAIFFGGLMILHAVPLAVKDKVANGLLADFVLTFPVLFYFVIVRPLKVSAKSLFLVFSICCGLAYLLLPQQQRGYILQIRKLSVLAELFVIGYAISQIKKLRAAYKLHQKQFADPIYNLRLSMADVLGKSPAIKLLAAEVAIIRYGLLFWKKEKTDPQYQSFSTHKDCGYVAMWSVLLAVVLIEIVAVHFLLLKWSHTAAVTLTIFSLYGTVIFIADLSAMLKRRVLTNGETIILRTGLRWRAITGLANIQSLQKITNDYTSDQPYFKGGVLKTSGNLLVTFKHPVKVDKLYGASKQYSSILMQVDDVDVFIACIS
ncbi:hypothetical protein [Mucilaginibacter polytrichastri]|uniref:Uncharacterized protein n=1 Tax=Mucilaginibacter polytrichastri TaxID=1302689 RepID=A0A1Q6A171_9SPHI|nr:hypothetical protein [Mucilaginibacter polytrichastri]OKS87722.1 hypothetical protein RG47T_3184 [Mucilaginibacter polytrichastri]SFT19995.1 hypothetical protein SAMN04487890_11639 [Mucilaginibacter polytrichastri]